MVTFDRVLQLLAFVLFVLAAWPITTGFNLVAAGLACLTLTLLV